jgi:hypothetical protein
MVLCLLVYQRILLNKKAPDAVWGFGVEPGESIPPWPAPQGLNVSPSTMPSRRGSAPPSSTVAPLRVAFTMVLTPLLWEATLTV